MIVGLGFIKRHGHLTPEKARIYATKSGVEFAVLDNGLALLPTAYEWEEVHEVESNENELDLDKLLDAIKEIP